MDEMEQPPKLPQEKIEDTIHRRLDEHDRNRIAVQNELNGICKGLLEEIDKAEERASAELGQAYEEEETRLLEAIHRRSNSTNNNDVKEENEDEEEFHTQQYTILKNDNEREVSKAITLRIERTKGGNGSIETLQALSRQHQENKESAAETIIAVCNGFREEVRCLKERINSELERKYTTEDKRLQSLLSGECGEETARAKLIVEQSYSLHEEEDKKGISSRYSLKTKHNLLKFKEKTNKFNIKEIRGGKIYFTPVLFNEKEREVLERFRILEEISTISMSYEEGGKTTEYKVNIEDNSFIPDFLRAETTYSFQIKVEYRGETSLLSEGVEFTTPVFKECCTWKECPKNIRFDDQRYYIDKKDPRIATKSRGLIMLGTVIGSTPLPLNTVTSWSIKILKSKYNDGKGISVGVISFGIDYIRMFNFNTIGWYLNCYDSTLCSGYPHNYKGLEYGPRKKEGEYVHNGDSVGVVMDTTKGELSFALNGANLGVAYEGILLDEPLMPCVTLKQGNDSVELNTSEFKENVETLINPSNITARSGGWDSVTLTWDTVEGASFYQIEVNESKFPDASTTNTFTKTGLLPDIEHTFRVRAVKGNSVSEWSDVVKGRALEKTNFSKCAWKNQSCGSKYTVNKNTRIATKTGDDGYCTINGNTPLPLNKVVSWSIKILNCYYSGEKDIWVGVAPFDIDQNKDNNNYNRGWYFRCWSSKLYSGPPHDYCNKMYGPRKNSGDYIKTGDKVGVVMDTTKGNLSFVVNGVNLGVAYEGIPLDKPLVPCVILENGGDSVQFTDPKVKESNSDCLIS